MESYVYTVEAARSRLRRGHKSVLVCQPFTCLLFRITKRNWKKVYKIMRNEVFFKD